MNITKEQKYANLKEALKKVPTELLRAELYRREGQRANDLTGIAKAFQISAKRLTSKSALHCYTQARCAASAIMRRERQMPPRTIGEIFHASSDRVRKWIRKHDRLMESCPYYESKYMAALEYEPKK